MDRLTDKEQALVSRVMASGFKDDVSAEEVAAIERFERCRAPQHGINDRLASLTRLKHLDLGYENRDPWTRKCDGFYEVDGVHFVNYRGPEFGTLEMSLASGINRLRTLRNLEIIGFECINHRIGRAELEWVAKS